MHAVAVSYLEWIRWVATGWFRCADRVVWLDGAEDQPGVDALMDRTPDLQVSDDQGCVIACLEPDVLLSVRQNGRERSLGQLWLSVEAVSRFHPLSARGARLLEADAERAAVRLGEPLFEKAWVDWRDRRLEDESHWRGLSLCAAFGLEVPTLKTVPHEVTEVLSGRKEPPNAANVREGAFEGTRALGWVSAISVAVAKPAVKTAFKETPEDGKIKTIIKEFRADFDLTRPLLDEKSVVNIARDIDAALQRLGAEVLPLELMATVLHYRSLATGGRRLSLSALVEDLVSIALTDPRHASLTAYFIGRSMENVAVTTLLYQSEPTRYAALAPGLARQQLNVMALAAARLEATHTVDEDQKANPSAVSAPEGNPAKQNLDATSGTSATTEEKRVGQPVGVQQTEHDVSDSSPGASTVLAISPPVPQGDSNLKGLTEASLVGVAGSQGGVSPTPSEEAGEKIDGPESPSVQPPTELFPLPMDGLEPLAVSVKGKKTRKKSDKAPEVGSAVEKSNDSSAE